MSVTWCLVMHALIYFIRIPMSMGIRSSVLVTDNDVAAARDCEELRDCDGNVLPEPCLN